MEGALDSEGRTVTRWDAQRADTVDANALPGLARLSSFVRSVRTPEFQGVTSMRSWPRAHRIMFRIPRACCLASGPSTLIGDVRRHVAYCFARNSHTRLELNIAEDFDREIIVKVNIVEVLRKELAKKRKLPPRVAFGTNTDVYQRVEGRYVLMPGTIDAFAATFFDSDKGYSHTARP